MHNLPIHLFETSSEKKIEMLVENFIKIFGIVLLFHCQQCSTFKFVTDLVKMETTVMLKCLLADQFYHLKSRSCHTPLTKGPCRPGEWLVLDHENTDMVTCETRPEAFSDCIAVFSPSGGPECQEDSEEEANMFKPCEDGVMVPENFMENTRPCPDGFRCQERNPQYWEAKRAFKLVDKEEVELELHFLEGLVCDAETKRICLPVEEKSEPLISPKNIIKTFQRPQAICKVNPCPIETWPWLDEEGVYRCLPASKSVQNCQYKLEMINGELDCPITGLYSFLGTIKESRCRRARVFSHGRCRPKFFG